MTADDLAIALEDLKEHLAVRCARCTHQRSQHGAIHGNCLASSIGDKWHECSCPEFVTGA